jgi:DNA-binding NarL/FixJ family response regulator
MAFRALNGGRLAAGGRMAHRSAGMPVNAEPLVAMDDEQLRVVVVDDHALFRRALRKSLEARGFALCAEVELGEHALPATLEHRPHVVLMDQRLPDLSGPEATRMILAQAPLTRVVAISAFGAEADLRAALAAGSAGYMLKSAGPEEIAAAVRAAAAGEAPVSPAVAVHLVEHFRRTTAPKHVARSAMLITQLSEREREILALIAAGRDNATIAEMLFISPHTVKGHVATILGRLGVANRTQAAVYAVRHGLG